jgi:hypothetical protein
MSDNTQALLQMFCSKTNINSTDCGNLTSQCTSACMSETGAWASEACATPLTNSAGEPIVLPLTIDGEKRAVSVSCQHLALAMKPDEITKGYAEKDPQLVAKASEEFGALIGILTSE